MSVNCRAQFVNNVPGFSSPPHTSPNSIDAVVYKSRKVSCTIGHFSLACNSLHMRFCCLFFFLQLIPPPRSATSVNCLTSQYACHLLMISDIHADCSVLRDEDGAEQVRRYITFIFTNPRHTFPS